MLCRKSLISYFLRFFFQLVTSSVFKGIHNLSRADPVDFSTSTSKNRYVVRRGRELDVNAVVFYSVGMVKASNLVEANRSSSKKSIDIYMFSGELERWFSALGHIYHEWELFVRNNDGAMVFSTWGPSQSKFVFASDPSSSNLLSYHTAKTQSGPSGFSSGKTHTTSPRNKKKLTLFRPTRSFDDESAYFVSTLLALINLLLLQFLNTMPVDSSGRSLSRTSSPS